MHASKTTRPNFIKFPILYVLPVAVARFSSDDSAMRYVLPVLWMAYFSHNAANEPESCTTLCFVEFARWQHRGRRCCLQLPACSKRVVNTFVKTLNSNRPSLRVAANHGQTVTSENALWSRCRLRMRRARRRRPVERSTIKRKGDERRPRRPVSMVASSAAVQRSSPASSTKLPKR